MKLFINIFTVFLIIIYVYICTVLAVSDYIYTCCFCHYFSYIFNQVLVDLLLVATSWTIQYVTCVTWMC